MPLSQGDMPTSHPPSVANIQTNLGSNRLLDPDRAPSKKNQKKTPPFGTEPCLPDRMHRYKRMLWHVLTMLPCWWLACHCFWRGVVSGGGRHR